MGQYKKGLKHGKGEFYLADGSSYIGDWVNDLRQGKGVETDPNGTTYQGNYKNGVKHGEGQLILVDGTKHKVTWSKGKNVTGQLKPLNTEL